MHEGGSGMTPSEALQALEIMLRPGAEQATPTIAWKVLLSFMEDLGIERQYVDG